MTTLVVSPARGPLVGSVPVPSDKSIGHRALLFAALCRGRSTIDGFSRGEDNVATANALRAMGIRIEEESPTRWIVEGKGIFGLRAPERPLDCGNSGTTMRLFAGLLAPQPFEAVLVGDASLSRRPMARVAEPLRQRGASIEGAAHPTKSGEITAPLRVKGLPEGSYLGPLEYTMPVTSAQVKSAILLSGLFAHGTTYVKEAMLSRDHTERMMRALGAPIRTVGTIVEIDPSGWNGEMSAFDVTLPGDISAAAFLVVAAQIVPGSKVDVRHVGVNPTRTGIVEIARDMGVAIHVSPEGDAGGEPVATIQIAPGTTRGIGIGGEVVPRAIDEIPIACALAARANGTTTIADAAELRVKESDRIATMIEVLRAFGVGCEERPDGLVVEGRGDRAPLRAATIASRGDHRIAMTAAVLGLVADGPTRVTDADCIATSFPRFVGTLRALGAEVSVEKD